jgi:acetylornithine aminotransferase
MTLAKGLGAGVPIGACLAYGDAAKIFKPGTHGSTFGGNLLACTAALATLEIVEDDKLLDNALAMGGLIREELGKGLKSTAGVREIRGRGLMIGIELNRPCGELVQRALEQGLLINVTMDSVIRLLPPLVIGEAEARQIVSILVPLVQQFLNQPQPQAAAR